MGTETMGRVLTEATIENLKDLWDAERGLLPPEKVRRVTVPDALVSRSTSRVASRGQSEDTRISEETVSDSGTPEGNANMASASSTVAAQWGAYG
jgi:hypothetical protein